MNLRDVIKKAVKNEDAKLAGKIAEKLRMKGLDYDGTYEFVNNVAPIELTEWESLLYESGANTMAKKTKADADNPGTVNELKTMGILPESEQPGGYPAIGPDDTWESLKDHPEVKARAEIIGELIKAGKPKLANAVSQAKLTAARAPVMGAKLTKQHFVAMAKAIAKLSSSSDRVMVLSALTPMLVASNPNFNMDRFKKAAKVE